ncbi:hypothetical protein JMJ77_0002335 [Colletotrichum scovillei]|uniref:Secreted protein n=1 Tax=Colletotrichum scovillei TaxID=1209932 RepID=A0A9P7R7S5_9PEZI|nr:hypothetical protein JMJ77_0002335 [Colletotrichum scovillei]KAG7070755.1 hypothetical protein JMJ76_0002001 [Colletotrichum scovillei]KAG7079023.1 hypothetical protein JMJ78_0002685 [Colletotrichum scovillei]
MERVLFTILVRLLDGLANQIPGQLLDGFDTSKHDINKHRRSPSRRSTERSSHPFRLWLNTYHIRHRLLQGPLRKR